jgi:hypothetical protein
MAAPEKESSTDYKWLEYTLYAAALAFVLIAVYQLVSTHRIVLLERETYPAGDEPPAEQPAADESG